MNAKIFETSRYLTRGKIRQIVSQVLVPQPADGILSTDDDFTKELVIYGEEVEASVGPPVEFFWLSDLMEEFLPR